METESQYSDSPGDFIGHPTTNSPEALIVIDGPISLEAAISKAIAIRNQDEIIVIRTYAQNLGHAILLILGGLIRQEKLKDRDI